MALDFPSSPSVNQVYSSGGNSWIWSGVAWKTYNASFNSSLSINGDIIFEGATDNLYETTLTVSDPTADRTVILPDASGTVALIAGSSAQVMFNDGGSALGGDSGLTYDKTTDSLTVNGDMTINGGIYLSATAVIDGGTF